MRVRGGLGCGGYYGGSGTVYFKGATQTYGDLIVDNENTPYTYGGETPLVTIRPAGRRARAGSVTDTTAPTSAGCSPARG